MDLLRMPGVHVLAVILQLLAVQSAVEGRRLLSQCGGFHCYDTCCQDDLGNERCCYSDLYHEPWFWVLVIIGVILLIVVLLCVFRICYRYHNAGQYTKLRLQQPQVYGTATPTQCRSQQPPRPAVMDDNCQLPSYSEAIGRPPAYSE